MPVSSLGAMTNTEQKLKALSRLQELQKRRLATMAAEKKETEARRNEERQRRRQQASTAPATIDHEAWIARRRELANRAARSEQLEHAASPEVASSPPRHHRSVAPLSPISTDVYDKLLGSQSILFHIPVESKEIKPAPPIVRWS